MNKVTITPFHAIQGYQSKHDKKYPTYARTTSSYSDGMVSAHVQGPRKTSKHITTYANKHLGIYNNDVLTVDTTKRPVVGDVVLAKIGNDCEPCRYTEHEGKQYLVCAKDKQFHYELHDALHSRIVGVVVKLTQSVKMLIQGTGIQFTAINP